MNVQQVIRLVDDIKPNAFSDEAISFCKILFYF